jgi:hypothetical protein
LRLSSPSRLQYTSASRSPERELIKRKREGDPEHDGDTQVPRRVPCREGGEPGQHHQQDAPEQMVDVKAGGGDDVVKRSARKQIEMNDGGEGTQQGERNQEGGQHPQRHSPSEREPFEVVTHAHHHHGIRRPVHAEGPYRKDKGGSVANK